MDDSEYLRGDVQIDRVDIVVAHVDLVVGDLALVRIKQREEAIDELEEDGGPLYHSGLALLAGLHSLLRFEVAVEQVLPMYDRVLSEVVEL